MFELSTKMKAFSLVASVQISSAGNTSETALLMVTFSCDHPKKYELEAICGHQTGIGGSIPDSLFLIPGILKSHNSCTELPGKIRRTGACSKVVSGAAVVVRVGMDGTAMRLSTAESSSEGAVERDSTV